jgi:putative SOS response-associated peptidase YedK
VPIVVEIREARVPQVIRARWGLVPAWWKQLKPPANTINARSEEAASKPLWRDSWRNARCLVPATHYYEWLRLRSGGKLPHALTTAGAGFMFAGLWAVWLNPATGIADASCAILTRPAADGISRIHDRMPVILAPPAWRRWIDHSVRHPARVEEILRANAVVDVRAYPVGSRVNTPRNDAPGLLDPAEDV